MDQTWTEQQFEALAKQLRHPSGTEGEQVAIRMNRGNERMNLATISHLQVMDNARVLEIGMGNGFFVKDILSQANEVKYVGCDVSPTMINEANRLNDRWTRYNKARFLLADADNLPFTNEYFDRVATVNTIYFWENPVAVISEIRRVLKKWGLLVITFRPRDVMEHLPVCKYGFRFYNGIDVTRLMEDNGFEVVDSVQRSDVPLKYGDMTLPNSFALVKAIRS
jgi:ubiquinone/menaquinone biosynthesis C-methylase UbiE